METDRWQQIRDSFHAALELPDATAQRALLAARHPDDPQLVEQVLGMLRADSVGDSLLERPVAQVAGELLQSTIPPGTRFGPYTALRVLGEGGMGIVCLAEREDLHSVAAIKVLRDAWLSPARRERFAVEQRVLAQLNHPGIARLYDADTLPDGTPWFAMDYVEGIALTEYCRRHACSIERRLQLFRQACEAVRYAHAHAVIHRDIKPSNMLVRTGGSVCLLDFGIAKQLDVLDQPAGATRTLFRLMTPAYAAPEQLLGEKVGVHTDVYSLGVVLYELLTDRLPFDLSNLSAHETRSVLTLHAPARPSQVAQPRGVSQPVAGKAQWADLDVLCLKAMHADPARRYSSVEALIRDIDHYLASEPLEARPESWSYRAGKFLRRNWQVAGVVAASVLLLLGLSLFFTLRLAGARDTALAQAARTERVQNLMLSLFQGGDALAGPATDLKVVDILDRGVQEAESLGTDPGVQAELLHDLGLIYQQLGQLDRAQPLLQSSLDLRTTLFGADSPEVAEGLVSLGLLRLDQAEPGEGERLIQQGYELAQRVLLPEHPQAIAATLALGRALSERGAYDEAIAMLSRAVTVQTASHAAPEDLAAALTELADAHYSAGHYQNSESLMRQVLGLHREALGESHPLVAGDLGRLAAIQQDLGYYQDAEQLMREALSITTAHYGEDSTHAADDLTSLGRALTYQARYEEAAATLERALRIQEAAYGPSHPLVAEIVNELGNVQAMRDNFKAAEDRFRRTAEIYRNVYGDQHYLVAIARSNVAYMLMQQGRYRQAEELFRDVVKVFSEALAPDNVNTGIARIKLGRTLLRDGRPADAEPETLAGYQILSGQASSSISYLQAARKDLTAIYEDLHKPDEAARFRQEALAMETSASSTDHQ